MQQLNALSASPCAPNVPSSRNSSSRPQPPYHAALTLTCTPPVGLNSAFWSSSRISYVVALIWMQPGLLVLSIRELVFMVSPAGVKVWGRRHLWR